MTTGFESNAEVKQVAAVQNTEGQHNSSEGFNGLYDELMKGDEARAVWTKCFDETKKAHIDKGVDPSKLPAKIEFDKPMEQMDREFHADLNRCASDPIGDLMLKKMYEGIIKQNEKK